MQINGNRRDFWGYIGSLRYLELAFRAIGMKVDIELSCHNYTRGKPKKYLAIEKGYSNRTFSLEDLTPDQAIKEAACFLASDYHGRLCSESLTHFKEGEKDGQT